MGNLNSEYSPSVSEFIARYKPRVITGEGQRISDEHMHRLRKRLGPDDWVLASVYLVERAKLLLVKNVDHGLWD